MASKRSRQYQEFFNRLKIAAKDLDSSRAIELLKGDGGFDLNTWHWMTSYVTVTNDRRERYQDFENMIQVPELNLGLVSYADDGTQLNENNKVIEITSNNEDIVKTLEETFFDNLDMNADLWRIFFGTCQYGDNFYELIVDDKKKNIMALKYLPPMNVERIEVDGNLMKFTVEKQVTQQGQEKTIYAHPGNQQKIPLEPWEVVHFKIEDNNYAPYGRSTFEAGRRTYKQLSLMEDSMLVYRLERAPEKRVFYVDIGNLSTPEGEKFIERIKAKFRKKKYIDPETGKINEKMTPLSMLEDFWIPVRTGAQGTQGTKIDILQGGRQLNEIDDTKYFRDKILKTMHIPPQYLQEGGGMESRNSLSQMDIKFARTVERIQRYIIKGLEKIAIVSLTLKGYTGDDLRNFELELTPPSSIAELLELEVMTQRIQLVSSMLTLENFMPRKWIYRNIMKFSDKEIADIETGLQLELASPLNKMSQGGEGGGFGAAPPLGGVGEVPGAAGPEAGGMGMPLPGAEAGGEVLPPEAGAEAGVEAGVPPPEAEMPAPEAPLGMEVAGKIIDIDRKQFLFENQAGIAKLLEYVKHRSNMNKDNDKQTISEDKDTPTLSNSYRKQFIRGEFRGLNESTKK